MKACTIFLPVSIFLLILFTNFSAYSQQTSVSTATPPFNEDELKANYDKFIGEIDGLALTKKYPEIVKKILLHNPDEQEIAVKMLSESQDIDAIPWILLLLDSDHKRVRTYAGYSLKEIVYSIAILRRDMNFPGFVVLKPLQKTDADLKPLAWIVLRLLRSEDQNHIAYAMMMARYLNLYEFEGLIMSHQYSRSPAVTNTMKWVLEALKLQKKYDANELKKEK